MENLDTRNAPRFVLDVDGIQAWIEAVVSAYPDGQRVSASPMDAEVSFGAEWSFGSSDGRPVSASSRQMLANVLIAVQELNLLRGPDGVAVDLESGDDGYRFSVVSEDRWPGLVLAGRDRFFSSPAEFNARGAVAVLGFLMDAVNEANSMLYALVHASTVVLAQLSTDPVLVTRLADHDESFVRAIAADNPVAPDEARVLRALRDRGENEV